MDKHKLRIISVATVAFVVFAGTVLVLKIFRTRRTRKLQLQLQNQAPTTPLTDVVVVNEVTSFDPSLNVSMSDIFAATKSFSHERCIGSGSFGLVYVARLAGRNLAVKRLGKDAYHDYNQFRSELEILGNLRHRNVARLLGYCVSGKDKILIYELSERGSLDICLQNGSLSWKTRVNVVRGVANGLAHLHELEKPIIHRNVRPKNIWLGLEFEAQISDFGHARRVAESSRSHVTTEECAVSGYTPPEYLGYRTATAKGDVYSFGVLMLEVATCRHAIELVEGKGRLLLEWAQVMAFQNREAEMIYSGGFQDPISESEMKEYFRIALTCANPNPLERPKMRDVVQLLRHL